MAEKYTLSLNAPNTKDVANFLNNMGIPSSKGPLNTLIKYMDFPARFDFYWTGFDSKEIMYRLEKIGSKEAGIVDFTANIVLPEKIEGLNGAILDRYVLVNLESKLLEKPVSGKILKKGRRYNFLANNLRQ